MIRDKRLGLMQEGRGSSSPRHSRLTGPLSSPSACSLPHPWALLPCSLVPWVHCILSLPARTELQPHSVKSPAYTSTSIPSLSCLCYLFSPLFPAISIFSSSHLWGRGYTVRKFRVSPPLLWLAYNGTRSRASSPTCASQPSRPDYLPMRMATVYP